MDEKGRKKRIDASEVLRITDIIPPFNHNASLRRDGESRSKPPAPPRPVRTEAESASESRSAHAAHAAGDTEIPTFDLAESILAEQRRVTARRRRRRQHVPVQHEAPKEKDTSLQTCVAEPAADELMELQQIVAEIVARDIARISRAARLGASR